MHSIPTQAGLFVSYPLSIRYCYLFHFCSWPTASWHATWIIRPMC